MTEFESYVVSKYDEVLSDQCYLEEEMRYIALTEALHQVNHGSQFAFYNLNIIQNELILISSLKIEEFNNKVFYLSKIKDLPKDLLSILSSTPDFSIQDAYKAAELIFKITTSIVDTTQAQDAEILIRTRGVYQYDGCRYWHIDKNRNQSVRDFGLEAERNYGDKVFLVSLFGEKTAYQNIDYEQRAIFNSLAHETGFYYGHDPAKDCTVNNSITELFKSGSDQMARSYHGSVHPVGANGTLHKEPDMSEFGRMILIITPIYHN
jgi:hypothetical protein